MSPLLAAMATATTTPWLPSTANKKELINRRVPWTSREAVELATLEWVVWFNQYRLLEPIDYIPRAEANYYPQLSEQACITA